MQRRLFIASLLILSLIFQSSLLAESNKPNPFSTDTCFHLESEVACSRIFEVYNAEPNIIGKIFYENLPPGWHRICFDYSNSPSGIYFLRSMDCNDTITKKLVLMHVKETDSKKKKEDRFDLCPRDGINYYLTQESDVLLLLSESGGQVLDTLINETQPKGQYAYFWDNTNWPSGNYNLAIKINGIRRLTVYFESDSTVRNKFKCYDPYMQDMPFAEMTDIKYEFKDTCHVQLVVYNIYGEAIDTLLNEIQMPGYHEVTWMGEEFPTGVYFCKVTICDTTLTKKLILLK